MSFHCLRVQTVTGATVVKIHGCHGRNRSVTPAARFPPWALKETVPPIGQKQHEHVYDAYMSIWCIHIHHFIHQRDKHMYLICFKDLYAASSLVFQKWFLMYTNPNHCKIQTKFLYFLHHSSVYNPLRAQITTCREITNNMQRKYGSKYMYQFNPVLLANSPTVANQPLAALPVGVSSSKQDWSTHLENNKHAVSWIQSRRVLKLLRVCVCVCCCAWQCNQCVAVR